MRAAPGTRASAPPRITLHLLNLRQTSSLASTFVNTFKRQDSHKMVRFVPFVMALVALGVTAGARVPSTKKDTADNAEKVNHGRRASSYKQPVLYCNFIGCPNGYAPIYDAQNVECKNGKCEVSQCCDLFCNSIGCPNGYTPIKDAHKVECYDEPCKASQCCEAFCSYHPCPNNYVPVYGAAHIQCPSSGCTDYLCCEDGRHHH